MPEGLWTRIQALLPEEKPKPRGGHPRKPDRKMMDAIYYVARTGLPVEGHSKMSWSAQHHP